MNEMYRAACASQKDQVQLCELPIAFAYAPMQRFCQLHDASAALAHGTLYKELDMPFCGSEARR